MLESLTIQNFRLFKDFKIETLSRVNLIVGENNVGKSSFLEAVYLLVSQGNPNVLLRLLRERGEVSVRDEREEFRGLRGYNISHLFFGHQLKNGLLLQLKATNTLPLTLKITFLTRKITSDENLLPQLHLFDLEDDVEDITGKALSYLAFNYGVNENFEVKVPVWGEVIDERRLRVASPTLPNRNFLDPNSNYITTQGVDYSALARLWDRITLTPKEESVVKMLKILEPHIERISFQSRQTSNSGILVKLKNKERPIPLGNMGDGMHRILAIAANLANSENGYLLVDEIDTGLHFHTITAMWRLIMETAERLNVQVFATTHSWDCVRSFTEALKMQKSKDVGSLFRLERNGEQIEAVKYTAEDLAFVISQNIQNLEVR